MKPAHLPFAALACVVACAPLLVAAADAPPASGHSAGPVPLVHAHAHNDYEHPRPLLDALDRGFRSVEADMWLSKDALLVAHTPLGLKPERTLQRLYLDPLRERVKANGAVYKNGPAFYLLVDVKTDAG